MQDKQINEIAKQMQDQQMALEKAKQLPQLQQMAQQNPQQAQQMLQQAQAALQQAQEAGQASIKKIMEKPNLDQVIDLLKNSRVKSFVLDIETDSTIIPNEQMEKQARTEFIGVLSQLLPQLSQMIMAQPETASFCGELLKFATTPFRAGRSLDGAINELTELMKQQIGQQKPPDPATMQSQTALQIEQMKLSYAKTKDDADRQVKMAEVQGKNQAIGADAQADAQAASIEVQGRQQEHMAKIAEINLEGRNMNQQHALDVQQMAIKAQMDAAKHAQQMQAAQQKQAAQMAHEQSRLAAQQFKPPQGLV
jgi:hypothetical protein